jgi:hypothetical protein
MVDLEILPGRLTMVQAEYFELKADPKKRPQNEKDDHRDQRIIEQAEQHQLFV